MKTKGKTEPRHTSGWVTKRALCDALDVTPARFDQLFAGAIPDDAKRGSGRNTRYWGRRILDLWALDQREQTPNDDLLLNGPPTPAMERYRNARAELIEMDVQQRRREVVAVADLDAPLRLAGGVFRRAVRNIQFRFGREAADAAEGALDEWWRAISEVFGLPAKYTKETDHGTDQNQHDGSGPVSRNARDNEGDSPGAATTGAESQAPEVAPATADGARPEGVTA